MALSALVFVAWANYHSRHAEWDLAGVYQAKTDEELLRLAMESDQLTSEAQAHLTRELGSRGINAEQISSFREEENLCRIGAPGWAENVAPQIVPRTDFNNIGAPVLSEMSTAPRGDRRLRGASLSSLVLSRAPWSWPLACAA
jgi:hypothetical protein